MNPRSEAVFAASQRSDRLVLALMSLGLMLWPVVFQLKDSVQDSWYASHLELQFSSQTKWQNALVMAVIYTSPPAAVEAI